MSATILKLPQQIEPRVSGPLGCFSITVRQLGDRYEWRILAQDAVCIGAGTKENESAAWNAANDTRAFLMRGATVDDEACPFCGDGDPEIVDPYPEVHAVCCRACGAMGPFDPEVPQSAEAALAQWRFRNRRNA